MSRFTLKINPLNEASINMELLGLDIPERTHAHNPLVFYAQPKKVEKWIAGLPRAHLGETSRLIYKGLSELNRLIVPAEQRSSVLELFLEPTEYIIRELKKHYLEQSFPLSSKNHKISILVLKILQELAIAYKTVVETELADKGKSFNQYRIALAIHRAMEQTNAILLHSYQTYTPHPDNIWLELHKLYQFSLDNNLHLIPIHHTRNSKDLDQNIEEMYKEILLFALVNPYQLTQNDIEFINRSLHRWTPFCALTNLVFSEISTSLFTVNLDQDEPPSYHTSGTTYNGNYLVLDTTTLANKIHDALAVAKNQNSTDSVKDDLEGLSSDTLRRIMLSWGLLSKRNFKRHNVSSQVHITLGITETHLFLSQRDSSDNTPSTISNRAIFNSKATEDSGILLDVWDFSSAGSRNKTQVISSNMEGSQHSQQQLSQDSQENGSHFFKITNESAGGYCLLWKPRTAGSLKVGNLLCIHQSTSENDTADYNICVVRWMKTIGDLMALGVEILTAFAQATSTKLLDDDGTYVEFTASLLLPALPSIKRPATLLTSTLYRSGDTLLLRTHNGEKKIKLANILQTATTFKQFQFSEFSEQNIKNTEEPDDFEAIWSSL